METYNSVHDWFVQGVEIDSVIDMSVARSRVISGCDITNVSGQIPIITFSSLLFMFSNFFFELELEIHMKIT